MQCRPIVCSAAQPDAVLGIFIRGKWSGGLSVVAVTDGV